MCKWAKYETTHTYTQYLKNRSFWSLRHSMRNKYLIGGWPSSCALKSYLSFLFPQALWQRKPEWKREGEIYVKRKRHEREDTERQKSWRAEWEVSWRKKHSIWSSSEAEMAHYRISLVELHLTTPMLLTK